MKSVLSKIITSKHSDISSLILRVTLGVIFIGHGWGKLFAEGNPAGFAGWLASMGIEPSYIMAVCAGLAETVGGLMLILGLLTRLSSASLIIVMLVAIGFVHLDSGMFGQGGYEFQLLLLVGVISILLQGAGKYSLDEVIHKRLN